MQGQGEEKSSFKDDRYTVLLLSLLKRLAGVTTYVEDFMRAVSRI